MNYQSTRHIYNKDREEGGNKQLFEGILDRKLTLTEFDDHV